MVPHMGEEGNVDNFIRHATPPADMAMNMFLSSLAFNFCLIAFFYAHHYLIFDRFVVPKKYFQYVVILALAFIIIFYGSRIFKRTVFDMPFMQRPVSFRELVRQLTWYLLVLAVSLGIKLLMQLRQAEQRAREIENAQLHTELSFLHAQINPHFLFNSLNTIYSLALKKSDSAPTAVLKLSHLLRYVIDSTIISSCKSYAAHPRSW